MDAITKSRRPGNCSHAWVYDDVAHLSCGRNAIRVHRQCAECREHEWGWVEAVEFWFNLGSYTARDPLRELLPKEVDDEVATEAP